MGWIVPFSQSSRHKRERRHPGQKPPGIYNDERPLNAERKSRATTLSTGILHFMNHLCCLKWSSESPHVAGYCAWMLSGDREACSAS
jgi:hypothetical protein